MVNEKAGDQIQLLSRFDTHYVSLSIDDTAILKNWQSFLLTDRTFANEQYQT